MMNILELPPPIRRRDSLVFNVLSSFPCCQVCVHVCILLKSACVALDLAYSILKTLQLVLEIGYMFRSRHSCRLFQVPIQAVFCFHVQLLVQHSLNINNLMLLEVSKLGAPTFTKWEQYSLFSFHHCRYVYLLILLSISRVFTRLDLFYGRSEWRAQSTFKPVSRCQKNMCIKRFDCGCTKYSNFVTIAHVYMGNLRMKCKDVSRREPQLRKYGANKRSCTSQTTVIIKVRLMREAQICSGTHHYIQKYISTYHRHGGISFLNGHKKL